MVRLGIFDCALGDIHGVFHAVFGIHLNANAVGENLELVDSRGTVDVAGNQQRAHGLLALEFLGKLAGEGCLTRTLQTRHKDDCGFAFDTQGSLLSAHEGGELIVNDFHHELSRLDGVDYILAESLLFYGIGKRLGNLIVDVGVDKRTTNVFKGFGNVDFGDAALAFEELEAALKSIAEFFEHVD